MKTVLLLPLPPPAAGPEIIAASLVEALPQKARRQITVINATIRKLNRSKGKLDISGMRGFFRIYRTLVGRLWHSEQLFMYLCSSRIGFLRDAVYIFTARLFRNRVVAQYHGGNFLRFYQLRSPLYRWFIRLTLGRLQHLLVLGENIKRDFADIYPLGNIQVLHNGIDAARFPMAGRTEKITPFTLFYLGHLSFPKGFYDLLRSYRQLRLEFGEQIQLLFAGERIGRKPALANFLNEQWAAHFLDNIDEITTAIDEFTDGAQRYGAKYLGVIDASVRLDALQQADLFVLPSYTEGLSMSCLEAMAAGLPVITTPVGAMSELLDNNQGGYLVPVGDSDQLTAAIRTLVLDKELSLKMGRINRARIESTFQVENVVARLLQILQLEE